MHYISQKCSNPECDDVVADATRGVPVDEGVGEQHLVAQRVVFQRQGGDVRERLGAFEFCSEKLTGSEPWGEWCVWR